MSNTIYRLGSANTYDNALRNLGARQTQLSNLQENLTSGKRVVRASDDPVSAAQAERALNRIERIKTDQRALENQKNAITQAESSLGDAVNLIQEARQLIVNAGSGTLKPEDRKTIALQLQGLRDQIQEVANRKDTNGQPLLGALGSALTPFLGSLSGSPDYNFIGLPGQVSGSGTSIPSVLDGDSAFMFDARRDGRFHASIAQGTNTQWPATGGPAVPSTSTNNRAMTASAVEVVNKNLIEVDANGDAYQYNVTFSAVALDPLTDTLTATYNITSTNPGFTPPGPQVIFPIKIGQNNAIEVTGVPGVKFTVNATPVRNPDGSILLAPANGDTITLEPSASIFSVMDKAINELRSAPNSNVANQAVSQALANLDSGLERLHNMRGYAGELLNRADRITGDQEKRSIQLEGDRSRAEDLDMIKGIADFQNQQTGYEAALKSYAQVQKLSLFNFIG